MSFDGKNSFDKWLGIGERPNRKKNFKYHPRYDLLSPIFQTEISPKEFAWMPDHERARFEDTMCLPEVEED